MKIFQGFNGAYQSHHDLKERLKEIDNKFNNRKEIEYDPQKYVKKVDSEMFRSKSSDNLLKLKESNKGMSKFYNYNTPCFLNTDQFKQYETKGTDEANFEKIKNVYSN
jgi:hypothetical protein